jgi:hypothetical protein
MHRPLEIYAMSLRIEVEVLRCKIKTTEQQLNGKRYELNAKQRLLKQVWERIDERAASENPVQN